MTEDASHRRTRAMRASDVARRGYDIADPQSILRYAKLMEGRTLREAVGSSLPAEPKSGNKGSFGQYIETHYFGYANNSDAEPDFVEAGLDPITP